MARDKLQRFGADLARTSLSTEAPATHVRPLPPGGETAGILLLHVDEIDLYDRNPRTARNTAYDDMKASIRAARGIVQKLTVTRRPDSSRYMIHAGGNTRLAILKELWAETRDEAFGVQPVMFEPWVSESRTFAAHLIENNKRADMSFWDRAMGCVRLREDLERERGESLSQRLQAEVFAETGFSLSRGMIQHYEYAAAHLAPLHRWLTNDNVKALQPAINALITLADRFGVSEHDAFHELFWPEMEGFVLELDSRPGADTGTLPVRDLILRLKSALAFHLNASVAVLDLWAERLRTDKHASAEILRALANAAPQPALGADRPGSHDTSYPASPSDGADGVTHAAEPPELDPSETLTAAKAAESAEAALDGGDAHASAGLTALSAVSRPPVITVETVADEAERLATLAGVQHAFVRTNSAPLGYFLEPEIESPTRVADDTYLAEATWWLLALGAGQFYQGVVNQLPPDAAWVRLMSRDSIASDASGHLLHPLTAFVERVANAHLDIATQQPMIYIDYFPVLLWHATGTGPVFTRWIDAIQRLRAAHPERFAFCDQFIFHKKEPVRS